MHAPPQKSARESLCLTVKVLKEVRLWRTALNSCHAQMIQRVDNTVQVAIGKHWTNGETAIG